MPSKPRSKQETHDLSHELGKTFVADLPEHLLVPRARPPHPDGAVLIALLTDEFAPDYAPPNSAIEIVDLATMNTVGSFSIGQREVTSLCGSTPRVAQLSALRHRLDERRRRRLQRQ
jgi:hypothetical protein